MLSIILSIIAFIILFTVLIVIHELGHFAAAKFFKVKVEEFGVGLPPKALTMWKKGETEYTLNWLPLGGFVRMLGEHDTGGKDAKDPRSFAKQAVWKRIIIAAAGVFMNLVLAYVLLTILFIVGLKPFTIVEDSAYPFSSPTYVLPSASFAEREGLVRVKADFIAPAQIVKITPGSTAEKANLESNAYILALNGNKITSSSQYIKDFRAIPVGQDFTLTLLKTNGQEYIKSIKKEGELLGIEVQSHFPYEATGKSYNVPWHKAPIVAAQEIGNQVRITFEAVGGLISSVFKSFSIPDSVGGPVSIATTVHVVATELGIGALFLLAVLISVNLAVFNILPFPALDGGRILFMLYELIFRKAPNPRAEAVIHLAGYALLIVLIIAVTYKDIMRLFM